jgi:glycosyltransferase involved in cell wall biosynthesis
LYGYTRRLEGIVNGLADAVITSTRHGADLLCREFGCAARRITVVPDGVDVDRFRPLADDSAQAARLACLRAALGLPAGVPVVVYLGLLAEYQGISALLDAARQVLAAEPDVHFLLLGYPGQEHYRARAEALGIADRVHFPGRIPYDKAPEHLALGSIAVAPKMSATEGNGKVLNYMAMALPVVGFDTPVNRELLGDLGLYAPLGDSAALAHRLIETVRAGAAASGQGEALRARAAARFSWQQSGARLEAVYSRLMSRG